MSGPATTGAGPFAIDGPAMISFSGGRTSGLMLRRTLDAGLRPDVLVLFANTGKERPETLDFVRDCGERWAVPITWLERAPDVGFRIVDHATASRDGEPFAALIRERNFLPNPVARFCTTELKIRVMKKYMLAQGYEHWTNVVGFRADERHRVAKARAREGKERWDSAFPLADAGVTVADVAAFWQAQDFDLYLNPWEGNCDLCMLKGADKKRRIIRDRPDLATWWEEQETATGATFRADAPRYSRLRLQVLAQPELPFGDPTGDDDDLGACSEACTD